MHSQLAQHGTAARRWLWFGAWAGTGLLCAAAILGILGIFVYLAPIAAIALVIVGLRAPRWPEILGFGLGPALLCLRMAAISFQIPSCATVPKEMYPGDPARFCGEAYPIPWLILGLAFLLGSLGVYIAARVSEPASV